MNMFCYQCEQTAGGKACTKVGVCGKSPEVANLQDLLIHQLKGIGFYGTILLERGEVIGEAVDKFMADAAFATLTNVNFDEERFVEFLKQSEEYKVELANRVGEVSNAPAGATYKLAQTKEAMLEDAVKVGIMAEPNLNEDLRSLRELLVYGLKGMAAYAHHARVLGKKDEEVDKGFYRYFAMTADDSLTVEDMVGNVLAFGQTNLRCMELLDGANTGTYGAQEPTYVNVNVKKGPFIIVSGHDLKDMEEILKQTEGKGINVYTHGELITANAYPELKKYPHLVGNYGSAWQNQQKEFDGLQGCIVMTTNCLQAPKASYADRIYSTSLVGFDGMKHIETVDGKKDFTPVIEQALALGGFTEDEEEKKILIGFGRHATLSHADKIIEAVKTGAVKHFFLIGGCDGAKPGRNYFTELAEKTPEDTVILTLACGKYRFNKLDFGTIGELPRLLDVGQCNDAFSAVKIALALAEAFECGVNDLPLSLVLSWYEQKAVCILLSLLSLGIKNIKLGPSLPAFISPNVLDVLVENFNIAPIKTAEEDLKEILG